MEVNMKQKQVPFCILLLNLFMLLTSSQGCPLGCKCNTDLKQASCVAIDLDNVPKHLPLFIEKLDLSKNSIRTVGMGSFPRQIKLIRLDLTNNRLTTLHEKSLNSEKSEMIKSLKWLSLKSNRLTEMPTDALVGLAKLDELSLANNQIKSLSSFAFDGLVDLQTLDLSKNKISSIANDAFRSLNNVKQLDLSSNQLITLSPSLFQHLTSLTRLNLSRNTLTKIHPEALTHFPRLQELHFSANRIQVLQDETFTYLAELLILDFSRNEITKIHSNAFQGLTRLVNLNLSHNMLTSIINDAGSYCLFNGMRSLRVLRLDSNRITSLPEKAAAWNGLNALSELHLSDNLISKFPILEENTRLPRLTLLEFSSNRLSLFNTSAFAAFPALERVDLSQNVISDVRSDAFAANIMLRDINLQGNKIKIPYATWTLGKQQRIDSRGHKRVSCVAHLADNPWICDCHALAFASSISNLNSQSDDSAKVYVNTDVMICDAPSKYKGQSLTEFSENTSLDCDVKPPPDNNLLVLTILILIFFGAFLIFSSRLPLKAIFPIYIQKSTKPISKYL
ncbi:uncharacterized protein LOC143452535 [Clavelina lepadiformis]|uniref:uncharacterized protein LOC143452535 n=1 Tax=Clavelina lepadiformis TaxID=159417 RepID=UPI0040416E82